MRFNTKTLTRALTGAALLAGVTAFAQTVAPPPPTAAPAPAPAPKTAPTQSTEGVNDLSTSLARASLTKQGIANPTSAQLATARQGVLSQRAQGMGWGQIANSLGVRLGDVVSAANRNKHADQAKETKTSKRSDTDKDGAGKKSAGKKSGPQHASRSTSTGKHSGTASASSNHGGYSSGGSQGGNGGGHGGGGGGGGGGHGGK